MVNHRLRRIIWCRKWAKTEWTIVAVGFSILIFVFSLVFDSPTEDTAASGVSLDPSATDLVPLTLLRNAKERGAFCLDGSAPGYHFQKGFGSGSDHWVLHVEGGGWCNSVASCSYRKTTDLGSSNYMDQQVQFSGILSQNRSENPGISVFPYMNGFVYMISSINFFNWNKVKIRYCDGGSFAGNLESEFKNGTQLFFKGQLIWDALMDELLSIGMSNSSQALLSGCSAGGLATLIHCDAFRQLFPKDANVKCLADAGFFLNEKDIAGNPTIESFYRQVVSLQGIAKSLDKDCLSRTEPSKCFFAQEFVKSIETPVFLVSPAYDFWQIQNILVPASSDPHGTWLKCRQHIRFCNPSQIEVLQGYRDSMLKEIAEIQKSKELGVFINSCFIHCQTWMTATWHSPNSPKINNQTIAESVGDWYFNKKAVKQIDCPYPCNPTCYDFLLKSLLRH